MRHKARNSFHPHLGELLWIDLWNWVNFGFCVLSLLESFLVHYLYYGEHGGENMAELTKKKGPSEMAELSAASAALIKRRQITTQRVDSFSKHFLPAAYAFSLACVWATTAMDNYKDDYTVESYQGLWPASHVDVWPPTVAMLVILAAFACLYRGRIHRAARKLANKIKGPAATAPPRRDLLGASSSSGGISGPRSSSNGVVQRETSAASESSLSNQPTQRESSTASESGPSIQPIQRDTSAASEAALSIQPCTLQVAPGSLIDKKNAIAAQFGWDVSTSMPKVASEAAHDLGITTGSKSLAELIHEVHAKLASVY
eukprot:scaffold16978_cov71-Phaeocystis_antarctica.AAC.4